jgi:hypothetical protein
MNLVRIALVALSVLLPTAWTIAKAADEPPPSGDTSTKSKSSKKKHSKKGEGGDTEKKGESDTGK